MPIGSLSDSFLANVAALQAHAENVAAAEANTQLRSWMLSVIAYWSGNPLDINGMAQAFTRTDNSNTYAAVLADPSKGSAGDAASAKLQSDYLALQERSFRLRHATPIACRLTAAARRLGHGAAGNGVFARVTSFAQDQLVAGSSGFVDEEDTGFVVF